MNSLSWFLYIVDVAVGVGDTISIVFWVGLVLVACLGVSAVVFNECASSEKAEECVTWIKKVLRVLLVMLCIEVGIPSQKTMYLILGSETGEELVTSETAKRVHKVVNMKLDEYLEKGKEVAKDVAKEVIN